jgi:extradiol dioxygenase family protein
MDNVLFHLAFPVTDIATTKAFYVDGLGCEAGREGPNSIILNLYGHQIVAHTTPDPSPPQKGIYPRHFGLVFENEADWEALVARAEEKGIDLLPKTQAPLHRQSPRAPHGVFRRPVPQPAGIQVLPLPLGHLRRSPTRPGWGTALPLCCGFITRLL